MEIRNELPPDFEKLQLVLNPPKHAVMTIDGVIYNPSGEEIDPDILEHEKVHIKQQKENPNYLTRYLTDEQYRLEVETEAYAEQLRYLKDEVKVTSNDLKQFLFEMARALSSDYKLNISYQEAENKIRNYGKGK